MEEKGEIGAPSVKLYGAWTSSYTHRVQLSLRLKGVEFEYVEVEQEDLGSCEASLQLSSYHNATVAAHKKVPVLAHGERVIVESVVILEYIEETWKDNPLMPLEPYERAVTRFWCRYADDKLGPAVGEVFRLTGEEQKAAADRVYDALKLVEGEMSEGGFKGRRFFGGDQIGVLDIVIGCGSYWLWVFEEVAGFKLVDPNLFPNFHAWLRDFEDQNQVKEIIPATDKLLEYAKALRQMILNHSKQL